MQRPEGLRHGTSLTLEVRMRFDLVFGLEFFCLFVSFFLPNVWCSDHLCHHHQWHFLNIQIHGPLSLSSESNSLLEQGPGICILCTHPKFENHTLRNGSNKRALLWPLLFVLCPILSRKRKNKISMLLIMFNTIWLAYNWVCLESNALAHYFWG